MNKTSFQILRVGLSLGNICKEKGSNSICPSEQFLYTLIYYLHHVTLYYLDNEGYNFS